MGIKTKPKIQRGASHTDDLTVVGTQSTVAPENTYSYANFEKEGFYAYKKGVSMYGGHTRDILRLDLE